MDNKKIGKLIAELRKEKGLTQQELGDMVGVGFRAVSKWERGVTLPDIAIINELSKVLEISLDELMAGELNVPLEEPKKNNLLRNKTVRILLVVIAFVIVLTSTIIYFNNRTYTYDMVSDDNSDYYVEGKIYIRKNKISIVANGFRFKDTEFLNTIITNYEYNVMTNDMLLFGYGFMEAVENLDRPMTMKEFIKSFSINYSGTTKVSKEEIIEDGMTLNLSFLTEEDKIIKKEIKINFSQIK